jgi:hypothetical protein
MPSHTVSERRKHKSGHRAGVRRILSSPRAKRKVGRTLGEFKRRTLKSSSGRKVTSRRQAVAIALSQARRKR